MVGDDNQRCLVGKILLQLVPNLSYLLVCRLDCRVSFWRLGSAQVLDMIDVHQVEQGQVRTAFAEDHIEHVGPHRVFGNFVTAFNTVVAIAAVAIDSVARLLALGEEHGSRVFPHELVLA
jgi:hypothetical protein